jgi:phage shock protein PspC (stress-responsive transcriptional regulator)
MKYLAKITTDKKLSGVCSGIAYSIGAPVWVVRLLTVLLALSTGVAVAAYLLLWIFMPKHAQTPADFEARTSRWFEPVGDLKA